MSASQRPIDNYIFEDIYKVSEDKQNIPALSFKGVSYTFKELNDSVNYFASKLIKKGVKPHDHVALLGMNSYSWVVAFYAIIKVGAVAVLLNYMSRHDPLVEAIKNSDCKYLVAGGYLAASREKGEFPRLLKEVGIDLDHELSLLQADLQFKDVLSRHKNIPEVPNAFSREIDSKRTSYIIFTTGTTSKPKAAMLSQFGMLNTIYHNLYKLDPVFPQKFMCLLPAFHCFGLLVINAYLAYQRTVYLNDLSNPVQLYKEFLKNKCGDYASVSFIYDKLARAPFWWWHRARFVKHCIVGGGFTSEQEFNFLEKKYGKGKFMNGYGQTECSPLVSLVYPDSPREKQRSTVGTPMEDIEIAIMDVNTKKIISNHEKGEILVKGYNVFNGYYKFDKDKQPFDENGYLHTGDLGYIDEDGYLVLNGRIKDIIIRKGENISPKEIEEELLKIPLFTKARVLGFPSIDDGEFMLAVVTLTKKPPHFVEETYLNELRKTLPSIKVPSHIIYMKKFPTTANGKLDEVKLREICLKKISLFIDKKLARQTAQLLRKTGKK